MPHRRFGTVAALLAVLAVAGCTPAASGPCAEPSVSLSVTVTDAAMDPSALSVCRGQEVTLSVTSETDGVLHVHGYDDQAPAVSLEPGEVIDIEFSADTAGQFIIELHSHEGGESTEVGVLTVNEP
jgi:hypothetical protein